MSYTVNNKNVDAVKVLNIRTHDLNVEAIKACIQLIDP